MSLARENLFYAAQVFNEKGKWTNLVLTIDDIRFRTRYGSIKLKLDDCSYYCFHNNSYRSTTTKIAEFAQLLLFHSGSEYGCIVFKTVNNIPVDLTISDKILQKVMKIIAIFRSA